MKVLVRFNKNIATPRQVKSFKLFDLGVVTTTIDNLLDSATIEIDDQTLPVLKINDYDVIKYYLINNVGLTPGLTYPYYTDDFMKDITINDLILINAGNGEMNVQADWGETNIFADNYIQNKPTSLSEFLNDLNFATEEYVDLAISNLPEVITNHSGLILDDGTNPHGTTKSDVGLSNVPNLDTTDAINNEHTHSNKVILDNITESFTTALKTAYDNVVTWVSTNGTNLVNHLSNFSNPHNVTKTQVGLSNVDNTSDLSKPISTATQTALNGKANTIHSHVISDVTGLQTALISKLDKVISSGVERAYIINADGSQSTKPTSDFSGSSVQSVSGDSVDNTDTLNPIINAIPLSGTTVGSPVSGDIEVLNTFINALGKTGLAISSDDNFVSLKRGDNQVVLGNEDYLLIDFPISANGLRGGQDFTPNITDLDYVQKKYVDNLVNTATNTATVTVELVNSLSTDFYAPYDLRINTTNTIFGVGTITLKVNDVAYTLTDLIIKGDKITVETNSESVFNLDIIYE